MPKMPSEDNLNLGTVFWADRQAFSADVLGQAETLRHFDFAKPYPQPIKLDF